LINLESKYDYHYTIEIPCRFPNQGETRTVQKSWGMMRDEFSGPMAKSQNGNDPAPRSGRQFFQRHLGNGTQFPWRVIILAVRSSRDGN
jgi:hypothetical protein